MSKSQGKATGRNRDPAIVTSSKWSSCLLSLLTLVSCHVLGESNEVIEEIVVTGSYIKRTTADMATPLTVVSEADIQRIHAADMQEIFRQLPSISGGIDRGVTTGGGGIEAGNDGRIPLNLRNLGFGQTLVLLNGRRHAPSGFEGDGNGFVDVNSLVPSTMLSRIEIVKDGASALYGSDAVAGVANLITKRDFEGLDVSLRYQVDEETRNGEEWDAQLLFGTQGDRGGVVVGAQWLTRNPIGYLDRYDDLTGGTGVSGTGAPGHQPISAGLVPDDDGDGFSDLFFTDGTPVPLDNGRRRLPRDPQGSSFGRADLNCEDMAEFDGIAGNIGLINDNDNCIHEWASFFSLQLEEEQTKFYVNANHRLTDAVEIYVEGGWSKAESFNANSILGNRGETIPVTNLGLLEDSRRRGIQPVPRVNRSRPMPGTINTPRSRIITGANGVQAEQALRPFETKRVTRRESLRFVTGLNAEFQLGDRNWNLDAALTFSDSHNVVDKVTDIRQKEMELALNGFGGPRCDPFTGTPGEGNIAFAQTGSSLAGDCFFFNPFGNSFFDEDGGPQTDLELVNPVELVLWLDGRRKRDQSLEQSVVDVVFSGEVIDLPSGPLGLAFGYQHRNQEFDLDFNINARQFNEAFLTGAEAIEAELSADAVFAEVRIPITPNLEINGAVRGEFFPDVDTESFDPKLTLLWRPTDAFSFRASAGTSFKIGSMMQLFGTQTNVRGFRDDFQDIERVTAFISTGNLELEPQESFASNVGFSWAPTAGSLEGFRVDIDRWAYDIDELITKEDPQALVSQDAADRIAGGPGLPEKVLRSPASLELIRVLPEFVNAGGLEVDGLDISLGYEFSTELGLARVGVDAAWIRTYDIELANGEIIDGVGSLNNNNLIGRALPEWKVNYNFSWMKNRHSAFLQIRMISEVEDELSQSTFRQLGLELVGRDPNDIVNPVLETTWWTDLFYTYTLPRLGIHPEGAEVTLGVRNLTDRLPPAQNTTGGFNSLHNPLGRQWMLRYEVSL